MERLIWFNGAIVVLHIVALKSVPTHSLNFCIKVQSDYHVTCFYFMHPLGTSGYFFGKLITLASGVRSDGIVYDKDIYWYCLW